MPGQNLTKAEAHTRSTQLSQVNYLVKLFLNPEGETFQSLTRIEFQASAGASTFVDLIAKEVKQVRLNGKDLDPKVWQDSRLELKDLQAENSLEVAANCYYMHTGEGLHRFSDPADNLTYVYSQFEVPDARRVYPCFEQPNLKASFSFEVTVPESWSVVSNSPTPSPVIFEGEGLWSTKTTGNPTGQDATGNLSQTPLRFHTFSFQPTKRISTYITAIVAGPFHAIRDRLTSSDGRLIELGVYCRQSLAKYLDAPFVLEQTKRGFEFYEKQFDFPYPFEKYDQIFVPEFNAGAMENAGCVTFRDEYVFRTPPTRARLETLANTILHELAHMWFGDLVTMQWWDDLWLNESFAEFTSYWCMSQATEFTDAWTGFAIRKVWGLNCDQMPTTHPIVAPINDLADVEVNFDGITYSKGACVLRQLVSYVGVDTFITALRRYFKKHAWSNACLQDLLAELKALSNKDLDAWSQVWLLQAGITELSGEVDRDENGKVISYRIRQTLPQTGTSLRPHSLTIGGYGPDANGQLICQQRWEIEVPANQAVTEVSELAGSQYPIFILNDTDVAYAKIRLDAESWRQVSAQIDSLADSLPRVVIMSAAWDMVRDGDLGASDFIQLVLRAAHSEENSTVLGGIIRYATSALFYYSWDPQANQPVLAQGLWNLAQKAEAGSDRQQQLVRGFLAVGGPDQIELLNQLYHQDQLLPGLPLTDDLRWQILKTLASVGGATAEQIDLMLQRDQTITGHEEAVQALAARPGVDNKVTWAKRVLEDTSLPNGQLESILAGLGSSLWLNPEDGKPLLDLYFDHLEQIWAQRTLHMAESIVEGLFPLELAGIPDLDLVGACQNWLERHPKAPRALRRKLLEEQDAAQRATRGKATDKKASNKAGL